MSNEITCIGYRFAVKNYSISSLASIGYRFAVKNYSISSLARIFNLSNLQSKNENPAQENRFKVAKYYESYAVFLGRSIQTHCVTVAVGRAAWVRFPQGSETIFRLGRFACF